MAKESPTRIERDTMGEVAVPAERYWGAQTQRSLENFRIGGERMPLPLIRALALQKKAAALANMALGALDAKTRQGDRRRRRRSDRRQARRRVPAGGLADRLGHPDQHEHERGARQPRQRDARRGKRGAKNAGASQRSRQSRPVLERQLPHRDACRRGRARSSIACCRRCTHLHARAGREGARSSPTSSRSGAPICRTRRR